MTGAVGTCWRHGPARASRAWRSPVSGAAQKGHFRARHFPGVVTLPVQNPLLLALGHFGYSRLCLVSGAMHALRVHACHLFRNLAVLSVGTRQHKHCAASGNPSSTRYGPARPQHYERHIFILPYVSRCSRRLQPQESALSTDSHRSMHRSYMFLIHLLEF